jgi:hypothetical protein
MASSEDEIYSTMFTSLKHPVRRKILRMLSNKPMTFMEMVDNLGVSTSHLTYHLENLGELVSKLDNGTYKLSTFGLATVSAMTGVEEAPQIEPKRKWRLPLKWKALFGTLLIAVIVLACVSTYGLMTLDKVSQSQQQLEEQNNQLLSWGLGADKAALLLQTVGRVDATKYSISLLKNTMDYRWDLGVAEESILYSLTSVDSNIQVSFRYRNNHFSRYALDMIESAPIMSEVQPTDVVQNAKNTLTRYQTYTGDSYITDMLNLLAKVNSTQDTPMVDDTLKLEIATTGSQVTFSWMYTENGIDFQTKGLMMTFQRNILIELTDGYYLYTIGNANLAVSREEAVDIAKNYVKTYTTKIDGKDVSGFKVLDSPDLDAPDSSTTVQLVPHTRGNSLALVPYYFVQMHLDKVYGGYNEVGIGVYADTGQVADANLLATST